MPRKDPFTAMCRQAAALAAPRRVDLHAHTTASDGDLTPSQLVAFARQAKVLALAVTDHDTTAGVEEARAATAGAGPEFVPGVELSASFRGREIHLLGLFLDPTNGPLCAALKRLCARRKERFRDYLAKIGVPIPAHLVAGVEAVSSALGRRHLATLIVKSGAARTRFDAFRRFLDPVRDRVLPKELLPAAEAMALVRAAGGITSLAHPSSDCDAGYLTELKSLGLTAVEAEHPSASNTQIDFLRETGRTLGLLVTGGSDSHGTDCPGRKVGDRGIGPEDWAGLRAAAGRD
ncbi:MAG TPA: PHP domain-containing protein [Fimbriiglobus sp.]|jgi:hypothetical protein